MFVGEHVLALILRMMAGGLLKTMSNWAVLTIGHRPVVAAGAHGSVLAGLVSDDW